MEHNMENIKVGDIVIFTIGEWSKKTIIDKVGNVTPKQFVVGAYRFWKKDGTMLGSRFNRCRIATEKDIEDFTVKKYRRELQNEICSFFSSYQNIKNLTIEEMEKIESIIKKKQ